MDPVYAAWTAAGTPRPADISTAPGHCARCGATGPIVATSRVVTSDFSGFDGWQQPTAGGLCAACTWCYRHASLRMHPHLVHRSPAQLSALTRSQLRDQLRHPLSPDLALAVPLRAGRKHVLPNAEWGRLTIDDVHVPWVKADAARLDTVERLRRDGVTTTQLAQAAPPYKLIAAASPDDAKGYREAWSQLLPWRQRPLWMQLATLATAAPVAVRS